MLRYENNVYGNMLLYEIKKNIFINAKNANENTKILPFI